MLKIVYDQEIPFVENVFSGMGILQKFRSAPIDKSVVENADILIIRSTLKINKEFLQNSKNLKVICTASAGLDHIDCEYIDQKGIKVFNSKGCNINAVCDYTMSAFMACIDADRFENKTIGIIGLGHIGKMVLNRFQCLGYSCIGYDIACDNSSTLNDIFACDVITLHIPLINHGKNCTENFLGEEEIKKIKPGAILINASRGGIVCEKYLCKRMLEKNDLKLAFDVWKNEPIIDKKLLDFCKISTPHIAGWSESARYNSINVLRKQCENYLQLDSQLLLNNNNLLKGNPNRKNKKLYSLESSNFSAKKIIKILLEKSVRIMEVSNEFKKLCESLPSAEEAFNYYRNTYKSRPQLDEFTIPSVGMEKKDVSLLKSFSISV